MTDVFKDFRVVIESADGARRGALTPDEFRASLGCPKTHFLADCVKDWNTKQERQGHGDRARIEMRTKPSGRRRRR